MVKAQIMFHKCFQNAQEYGSKDEYLVSRVFFSLQLPDKRIDDLYVDVKQTVGATFESGTLEIGLPQGFKDTINHALFRNAVEKYYRSLVGSTGSAIKITSGSNIRMFDNWIIKPMTAEIEVNKNAAGGW